MLPICCDVILPLLLINISQFLPSSPCDLSQKRQTLVVLSTDFKFTMEFGNFADQGGAGNTNYLLRTASLSYHLHFLTFAKWNHIPGTFKSVPAPAEHVSASPQNVISLSLQLETGFPSVIIQAVLIVQNYILRNGTTVQMLHSGVPEFDSHKLFWDNKLLRIQLASSGHYLAGNKALKILNCDHWWKYKVTFGVYQLGKTKTQFRWILVDTSLLSRSLCLTSLPLVMLCTWYSVVFHCFPQYCRVFSEVFHCVRQYCQVFSLSCCQVKCHKCLGSVCCHLQIPADFQWFLTYLCPT